MMAPVTSLDVATAEALATLGYLRGEHRPSEALWFAKPLLEPWDQRTHQLHLTVQGSNLWVERLTFRDALRSSSALTAEYQAIKLSLAGHLVNDPAGYTASKRPFIARVLADHGVQL